jgi:hypothetical protein
MIIVLDMLDTSSPHIYVSRTTEGDVFDYGISKSMHVMFFKGAYTPISMSCGGKSLKSRFSEISGTFCVLIDQRSSEFWRLYLI